MAADELAQRVKDLSQALLDKEKDVLAGQERNSYLQQELESARAELGAAREELRNEATKCSLLEQRLRRTGEDLANCRAELTSCSNERDTLHRTLGRVHEQLTSLKSESSGKALQLTELQLYYDGLLQAKEASIQSLQALLEGQQKQLNEQQALWEDQRRSLKANLEELSSRVLAAQKRPQALPTDISAQASLIAELQGKLSRAERAAAKAGELLRERERQIAKLQHREQRERRGEGHGHSHGHRPVHGHDRHGLALGSDTDTVSSVSRLREAGWALGLGEGSSTVSSGGLDSTTGDTERYVDRMEALGRQAGDGGKHGGETAASALKVALEAERHKHGKTRSRLALAEREGADLRVQVARLRSQIADLTPGSASGANVQLADELLKAHRTIQELELQLRRVRETNPAGNGIAGADVAIIGRDAAAGPGALTPSEHLALLRQRLVRQRQEFEQVLERVASEVYSRSGVMVLAEDLRGLMEKHLTQVDTLASMSALPEAHRDIPGMGIVRGGDTAALTSSAAVHSQQQQQHSLFVVRAAWSTLRRALVTLQEAVSASLDVSANPAVAYLQGADFLARLMREWAVGEKPALDAAVEASMSAGVALVQEAAARLQSHAVDLGVARQQLREAQDAVAQQRLTNELVQKEGEKRLAEARSELGELREELEQARSDALSAQRETVARLKDLESLRERADAAEAALESADMERTRLRKVLATLEGDRGSAEAAVTSRDEELMRLRRALSDAHATIAMLHHRIETQQTSGSSEITQLKTKIRDVVTALESPNLSQLHAMMSGTEASDSDTYTGATIGSSSALAAIRGGTSSCSTTPGKARRPGSSGLRSEGSLNALALGLKVSAETATRQRGGSGLDDDPRVLGGSLQAALDAASNSCCAALHRLALLEVAHHEAASGVSAVAAVRDHLASAATEMAAGRTTVGEVMLSELLSMISDSRASSVASAVGGGHLTLPSASSDSAGGGGPLAIGEQLAAARDASQHVTRHLKNLEGMILAIKSALPEWLELCTARMTASHRTELSRLRGLLGGQLTALRRDMQELRASCSAQIADSARHASEALQQAQSIASAADRDRSEAAQQLVHLQKDLRLVADATASMASAAAWASLGAGAGTNTAADRHGSGLFTGDGTDPPHGQPHTGALSYSLASAATAAARVVPELRLGLERLQRDLAVLASERDAARGAAEAAMAHGSLLVRCVAEAVPLPEMLLVALLNTGTGPDPGLSAVWCGQLRDCVAAHVSSVQSAAVERVLLEQVEPRQRKVATMEAELKAARKRVKALQAQAARFVEDSNAALEACRREAGEAAATVLESVMIGVREEVAAVQSQLSELQDGSSEALQRAEAAWAAQLDQARASGAAAVTALEESVAALQAQLGSEADAYDALRAESEAATKEAAERLAAESSRARSLSTELAAARERLASLEAAEAALEGENRGLRKALRQRDTMVMGMLGEGPPGLGAAQGQAQAMQRRSDSEQGY